MKKIIIVLLVLIAFSSCQQQNQKIGFVDRSEVINKYQAKIDLEEKYKGKNEVYIKHNHAFFEAKNSLPKVDQYFKIKRACFVEFFN